MNEKKNRGGRFASVIAAIMVAGIVLSTASGIASAAPQGYYVYKETDGTIWYSNRKLSSTQFKLIATIGRPTARTSCKSGEISRRYRIHAPLIVHYAKNNEVDPNLIRAIIRVESCFDRYAVSRVGAKGLMQLMPRTAQELGVSNEFNAEQNIQAGTRYISEMLLRFGNDLELALAAYNAGPEAVEKYRGIPPYKETQNYVKRVMKHYQQYAASDY